jgi:SAM-dependent methyltransferase
MNGYDLEYFLRPRSLVRRFWDFVGAPLRMAVFPDHISRSMGLTSLQEERMRAVLREVDGRVLDIGAGDNLLVRVYGNGIGVDVYDVPGGATIVDDSRKLPFEDASFDTITFIACLNHIPCREEVLREAFRLLRPEGRVIATMISPSLGAIGHAIWWYSEEKHRHTAPGEVGGISRRDMKRLFEDCGFEIAGERTFLYGLNRLYIAEKAEKCAR